MFYKKIFIYLQSTNINTDMSREIVKIHGAEIVANSDSVKDWRGLVARFISLEDVSQSSRALYTRTLTQFFVWLEKTNRMDLFTSKLLNRTDILSYKDNLTEQGLSPLTISSYLVVVRKFFTALESYNLYPNIAKGIKTPKKEKGFRKAHLTDNKSTELLTHSKENNSLRDYAIINLMLRTGLRTIEVTRANVGDITYKGDRRILWVWGKGHDRKDNFVVLTDKAYLPIKEYLDNERKGAKSGEPLFISESIRNKGGRLTTRTISGIAKENFRAIGIDSHEYTAHSLRHTTACAILKHGGQLTDAQGVLRHASPVTTQIYTASIEEELRLSKAPEMVLDNAF